MGETISDRLPAADAEAIANSRRLVDRIIDQIRSSGGWIGFDRFMHSALYEPGLGYYAAKPGKLGPEGDFVTAPEISPLFARALAAQVAGCFEQLPPRLIEFGAGSGALAAELIAELERLGVEAERYGIVEVSPELRARQQARLLDPRVQWLNAPPAGFDGVIVANEVLDVMPVQLFVKRDGAVLERGVQADGSTLRLADRPAADALREAVEQIEAEAGPLPDGYVSEVGLLARAWTATLGTWLRRGVALLIDYGFPRHEYYHPQRAMGTLMCHFRHRAHADPLWLPGLNDITAHVDFSAIAQAARGSGLDVLGYTSQARFLLDCGLLQLLAEPSGASRTPDVLRLLSESEMGELLKVLAVGRGLHSPLLGFASGDRSHRLL
ncbi:MAG TPA: SAM-dependent methyltransferase [Burkholderiaceae bacterium]|nr:SAM-dependent methyltransferase [Burkholderiaceae bacterium]